MEHLVLLVFLIIAFHLYGLNSTGIFKLSMNIPPKLGYDMEPSFSYWGQPIEDTIDPAISCSIICIEHDCAVFSIKNSTCYLFNRLVVRKTLDLNLPLNVFCNRISSKPDLPVEVILFRQDMSKEVLLWPRDVTSINKDNPMAELYAKLDEIEDYRSIDGDLHLKICYPGTFDTCFRWKQTDDPLTVTGDSHPQGFAYKDGPIDIHAGFVGLSRSTPDRALLDGDVTDSEAWYLAIGSYETVVSGQEMPGTRVPRGLVQIVELFAELV